MRAAILLALSGALVGCAQLKPGHCFHTSDCAAGFMCTQGTCLPAPVDAGMKSDAGRDMGVDTGPPSCNSKTNPIVCKDPTPFCGDDGMCRGCNKHSECAGDDGGAPFCDAPDGGTGMCVQCVDDSPCTDPAASACRSHVCAACVADSDCSKFTTSVCKAGVATGDAAPPPGHCATTDVEVIYVSKSSSCSDMPAADGGSPDAGVLGGTMAHPFCSMQPALNAITKERNVIVISGGVGAGAWTYADQAKGPLLIVGQNKAAIGGSGTPAFSMSSGTVTIRNVTFNSQFSTGIEASGGMLTLDKVVVQSSVGGILFDGGSFDVENSTITGNALATDGLISWSGIYVKTMAPSGVYRLNQVTVTMNTNAGVQCVGPIKGTSVLAYKNGGGVDVGTLCGFDSCGSPDGAIPAKCGAQM